MTSSSEQTTALIAEAREMGTEDRTEVAAMIDRLADALEAATSELEARPQRFVICEHCNHQQRIRSVAPSVVSTVAELDALGGNSVLYSEKAWAVLRKQSHGSMWVTDHGSQNLPSLTGAEVMAWVQDWQLLRVGGTE